MRSRHSCEGGAVAIDGGSSSFDGDKFSGNTGDVGQQRTFTSATSATTADDTGNTAPQPALHLASVVFDMVDNATSRSSSAGSTNIALTTGVAISNNALPQAGATFSCPRGQPYRACPLRQHFAANPVLRARILCAMARCSLVMPAILCVVSIWR